MPDAKHRTEEVIHLLSGRTRGDAIEEAVAVLVISLVAKIADDFRQIERQSQPIVSDLGVSGCVNQTVPSPQSLVRRSPAARSTRHRGTRNSLAARTTRRECPGAPATPGTGNSRTADCQRACEKAVRDLEAGAGRQPSVNQ